MATRQTDDSSSVIQIPTTPPPPPTTTTPIIPNRREIRGWVIVGKQIVSFMLTDTYKAVSICLSTITPYLISLLFGIIGGVVVGGAGI